jgi:tyrosyl-tRNA synthetase
MNFITELKWRGMIHDIMPGTEDQFNDEMTTAYIGFDPTADSLHVGSLVQIMTLVHLQKSGHKPIILVGGATGMVGDPSGKSEERNLLDEKTLNQNLNSVKNQLQCFLDFNCGENSAEILNNFDWFKEISFLNFIRDVGKHISVNYMMSKDSVKSRLESGMSFTEFSYQLVQGYDFYYLWKNKNCKVQLGGSDQWGNIVLGMEIISKINKKDAFGLTTPLLTTSTGKKMGKTEQGAVWIDQNKYSSYDFYQYWRNVDDNDVEKLLLIFSDLDKEEIKILIKEDINNAKKKLAYLVTTDCHSESSAQEAEEKARSIFENNSYDNIDEINFKIDSKLIDTLTSNSSVSSKSEAKRLIEGGGIKIDDDQINDINLTIDKSYNGKILKIGKKKYFKIIVK